MCGPNSQSSRESVIARFGGEPGLFRRYLSGSLRLADKAPGPGMRTTVDVAQGVYACRAALTPRGWC